MGGPDLKPWSLRPLGRLILLMYSMFALFILGLMVYMLPRMQLCLFSKLLVLALTFGGAGCIVALRKWTRYWPDVAWEVSFFRFISEPAPPDAYPEAVLAWRWGRRYAVSWIVVAASVLLIPVAEWLAG